MRKLALLCIAIATGLALCQSCGPRYYNLSEDSTSGDLTFVNTTSHTVTVYVDGSRKGTVSGGSNRTWWVGSGYHSISWESYYGSGGDTVDCTDGAILVLQD